MRRIVAVGFAAVVLTFGVLSSLGADRAATPPAKGKAGKTVAPSYGNADAITEEELKVYLYFLASDQLEGRNFPSRGYDTAALWVADHLAEWGLKPGGSASGTNGPLQPYLMPIELVAKTVVPEDSKVSLTAPAPAGRGGELARGSQTTAFEYARDWAAGGGGRGALPVEPLDASADLVFAGNGYVINKNRTNPYEGLDVRGKIIVVAGLPPELAAHQGGGGRGGRGGGRGGRGTSNAGGNTPANAPEAEDGGRGRGGAANNPLGENCTDFYSPEAYAAKNGALAVVTVASFQQLGTLGSPNGGRGPSFNGPNYQVKKFQQSTCPAAPSILAGAALTNALFQGEKLNGPAVFYGAGANNKQDSFALNTAKKLTLHIAVHEQAGHGENVVGMLEGSDPVLKNEYVVMSAHLDHIGLAAPLPDGHNVNNGADDDGSGSTGLLAIAHAYAAGAAKGIRPRRSVIFLWNGGEEKGLLGSRYYAEFPPMELDKVVANLNMDMIGRTKDGKAADSNPTHVLVKPGEVLVIGPNISSDELEQTIEGVNNNYQKLSLNHFYDVTAPDATHDNLGPPPNGQRIFYRSDHYNFAKMGIPIAFFTTGLHEDYHRATDTPDKIDYREMQQISKTVAATGWELANQNGRPKLNANLPEQLIKDMKTAKEQGWGKPTPVLPPLPGEPY